METYRMAFIGSSKSQSLRPTRRAVVGSSLGSLGALGLGGLSMAKAQGTPTATDDAIARGQVVVEVVGTDTVDVAPDSASIVIGVDVTMPTLGEAQSEATTTMEAVIAAIGGHDIPDDDIQTATFMVNPIREYDQATGVPGAVTSFQVTNQVAVTTHDLDDLGALLDDAVGAGANSIYGITFFLEDPAEANAEARKQAFADARTRATELADAAGLSLGSVIAISEGGGSTPIAYYDAANGRGQAAGGPPVSPGVTSITVAVTAAFSMV
jgi:uncharacterized protein YggE